jgi:hypothetical protein
MLDNLLFLRIKIVTFELMTQYGLDGSGLNPDGDEIFRTHPDQP